MPAPQPEHAVPWAELQEEGYGDATLAISLTSQPDMSENRTTYIVFVDPEGRARVHVADKVEFGGIGPIAARDGVLCVPTHNRLFRVTAESGDRYQPTGELGVTGHWPGVRRDGSCVFVSNDANETGIYSIRGPRQRRSDVPVSPGRTGTTVDAVWVSNTGTGRGVDLFGPT